MAPAADERACLSPFLSILDPRCQLGVFRGKTDPQAPSHWQHHALGSHGYSRDENHPGCDSGWAGGCSGLASQERLTSVCGSGPGQVVWAALVLDRGAKPP